MALPLIFKPAVIAHRGASAYAPENTLSAFIKAAQLGIRWVEFDVMQAACGTLVVFHDEALNRTTNGKGLLEHFSYQYLQTLDAGRWFSPQYADEKIPTLQQVLNFLKQTGMAANIEIKASSGHEDKLIKQLIQEVQAVFPLNSQFLLFSSFSVQALACLKQHVPDCYRGMLLHEWEPNWQQTYKTLGCYSLNVNHEILTAELTKQIKQEGKTLLAYTVNEPNRAEQLYAWGVDAVFSDKPDEVMR